MKLKDKLLWLWLRKSREEGFSLPFVIGIGLIMTLVGLTMIVRSSDDKVDASAQKGAANSMVAAEVGITRVQNFLNNNRLLTAYNFKSPPAPGTTHTWQTITSLTTTEQEALFGICSTGGGVTTAVQELQRYTSTNWQTIDAGNNPLRGQFRVEDYVYTAKDGINPDSAKTGAILGQGVLTVRGRFNANANTDTSASLSRVQITIPVTKTPPDSVVFPGIWVGGGTIYSNNTIDGDLLVKGCNPNIGGTLVAGRKRLASPTLDFPALPPKPGDAAFNAKNYTFTNLGNINTDLTLPRTGDAFDTIGGVKIYRYLVNNIEMAGGSVKLLTINTNATQRVIFYVTGDINVSGNREIRHQQAGTSGSPPLKPANFQIYGYKADPTPGTVNKTTDPHICMNGSGTTYGFIFAPSYVAGIAGAGGSTAGFIGSIWIQQWNPGGSDGFSSCGSNTSNTVLTQNIGWEDLTDVESVLGVALVPRNLPPTLHPPIEWKRLEFN